MNHKQRRAAKYLALGMPHKAEFASVSPNNRSKRARGKNRLLFWVRRRNRYDQARQERLNYPPKKEC